MKDIKFLSKRVKPNIFWKVINKDNKVAMIITRQRGSASPNITKTKIQNNITFIIFKISLIDNHYKKI